jgi:hypothetical protein
VPTVAQHLIAGMRGTIFNNAPFWNRMESGGAPQLRLEQPEMECLAWQPRS